MTQLFGGRRSGKSDVISGLDIPRIFDLLGCIDWNMLHPTKTVPLHLTSRIGVIWT
jgi:hypothetical protein